MYKITKLQNFLKIITFPLYLLLKGLLFMLSLFLTFLVKTEKLDNFINSINSYLNTIWSKKIQNRFNNLINILMKDFQDYYLENGTKNQAIKATRVISKVVFIGFIFIVLTAIFGFVNVFLWVLGVYVNYMEDKS